VARRGQNEGVLLVPVLLNLARSVSALQILTRRDSNRFLVTTAWVVVGVLLKFMTASPAAQWDRVQLLYRPLHCARPVSCVALLSQLSERVLIMLAKMLDQTESSQSNRINALRQTVEVLDSFKALLSEQGRLGRQWALAATNTIRDLNELRRRCIEAQVTSKWPSGCILEQWVPVKGNIPDPDNSLGSIITGPATGDQCTFTAASIEEAKGVVGSPVDANSSSVNPLTKTLQDDFVRFLDAFVGVLCLFPTGVGQP
jgi:hypothetical protein